MVFNGDHLKPLNYGKEKFTNDRLNSDQIHAITFIMVNLGLIVLVTLVIKCIHLFCGLIITIICGKYLESKKRINRYEYIIQ